MTKFAAVSLVAALTGIVGVAHAQIV